MCVTNRSNDAVWGALGANAVHFSMLQEYLAVMIGCAVGKYWQVTNNLHLYLDHHKELMETMAAKAFPSDQFNSSCPYETGRVEPTPLIPGGNVLKFDADIAMLLDEGAALGMTDWFCRKVGGPMLESIRLYKAQNESNRDRINKAQARLWDMPIKSDWLLAGQDWLERRRK